MKSKFKQTVGIGDAAKLTGVSQKQLRSWEGRHFPEPDRVVCGERAYRRYTLVQIEQIKKIKEYRDQGYTLEAASKFAKQEVLKNAEKQ